MPSDPHRRPPSTSPPAAAVARAAAPAVMPVAYATRTTDVPLAADLPPVTGRTAAAAAWLAGVLAALAVALYELCDQQQAAAYALTGSSVAALLAPDQLPHLALTIAGPAAFAAGIGAVAAALLYDWRPNRLMWVALLPAVAGCWSALTVARPSSSGPSGLPVLAAVVVAQGGLAFAGTAVGRPAARWLARRLVPPPLRASLVALWV